jgi:uncharacterized protein YwqG
MLRTKPVPLPRTREEFFESLNTTGLDADIVEHLTAQARPAVLMTTVPSDEEAVPLGANKLGGAPHLPAGMAWPMRPPYPDARRRAELHREQAARYRTNAKMPNAWMAVDDAERFAHEREALADAVGKPFPLAFLGQFDLAALSKEEGFDATFPDEGRLLIFYDLWAGPEEFVPEASAGWLVLWDQSPPSALAKAAVPDRLSALAVHGLKPVFRPAAIQTCTIMTPIPPNDKTWDAFSLDDDEALEVYEEWLSQFGTPDRADGENHQLGGFPRPLQNGLQARSQLAANGINCGHSDVWDTPAARELVKHAKDWRLALQIGVDANAGIGVDEQTGITVGACYVMLREQDIAARRFDQARVVFQSD